LIKLEQGLRRTIELTCASSVFKISNPTLYLVKPFSFTHGASGEAGVERLVSMLTQLKPYFRKNYRFTRW